jgi:nicotinamide phosphoribosyltransferase
MSNNVINFTDSYKVSHWMQEPEGTEFIQSYVVPRSKKITIAQVFAIQAYVKRMLLKQITMDDINAAEQLLLPHLGPGIFNRNGWERIVKECNGYLPLRLRAIKEGTVVPTQVAIATVENTRKGFGWCSSYIEPGLLNHAWYGTTVATTSFLCKKAIKQYLDLTCDDTDAVMPFMLNDFGFRGTALGADLGSTGHLINFLGTDSIVGMIAAIECYNAQPGVGLSVIATEHSTSCINSDAANRDDYAIAEKMVGILEDRVRETGEFQIVATVADTYDVYRYAEEFIGTRLKDRIMNSGGRLVVRPDSGDPLEVPIKIVEILLEKFPYTMVGKGKKYKLLPPCIRVLQGDGINRESLPKILEIAEKRGLSAENFVFGMGGGLVQDCDRDTLGFAMKASAVRINGEWRDVFKDPITDPGKTSLKGRLTTVREQDGTVITKRIEEVLDTDIDLMETVYEDGQLLRDQTFEEIREIASSYL